MPPLSLTLVMAGGASLGAYHGGALAALLTGLSRPAREGHVRLDAVGGTSAGAIAAVLAAHAWLEGIDPVWLMHEAWVERVSAELLRSRSGSAPLSFEQLEASIDELLDPADQSVRCAPSDAPLGLHVTLVNLHGLTYTLPTAGDDQGATYDDFAAYVLHPGGGVPQMRTPAGSAPLDAALASAANPGAFAPRALTRGGAALPTPDGRELHREQTYWYSDGGPLSSAPVGRVIDMALRVAGDDARSGHVAVVLDPRSEGPTDPGFVGLDDPPSWLGGLARTLAILPEQALSMDLRRIGERNTRLGAAEVLADVLADVVDDARLERLAEVVRDRALPQGHTSDGPGDVHTLADVLRALAGVQGQVEVRCDQISPRLLDPDADTGALLSGELLGDFAGFVDRRLRRNDFLLGWDCADRWMERRLGDLGVQASVVETALADTAAARPPGSIDQALASATARRVAIPLARSVSRMLTGGIVDRIRSRLPARR